jgi:transcription termination factor Rho
MAADQQRLRNSTPTSIKEYIVNKLLTITAATVFALATGIAFADEGKDKDEGHGKRHFCQELKEYLEKGEHKAETAKYERAEKEWKEDCRRHEKDEDGERADRDDRREHGDRADRDDRREHGDRDDRREHGDRDERREHDGDKGDKGEKADKS